MYTGAAKISHMNLIVFLFKSSWQSAAIALITGIISGGCSAGLIALISQTVAQSTPPSNATITTFVTLGAVTLAAATTARILLVRFSQAVVFDLQMRLSRQILATELKPLETIGLPRLLVILTEDIQVVATAVGFLPVLTINIASAAGCMVYISWLSWQVLALVVLLSVIATISCQWFLIRGKQALTSAREQQDRLFQHFRSLIDGVKELKLQYYGRQDFLNADLEWTARQMQHSNRLGLSLLAVLDSWGKFIYFFAVGLILFLLPQWIEISLQTRVAYVLTFTYLLGPMENLVNKLPMLSKAGIALSRIKALGLSLNAPERLAIAPAPIAEQPHLRLQQVTHTYRTDRGDREFTLGPIDLAARPGELIFIVGGNGSGKSTLAKLLTGLYQPQSGSIWLNDQPIDPAHQEWYRQHFSAVFSDFYLFERLLDAKKATDDASALKYLKQLQLDHKVNIDQGQFSTTALSQGQRKRLTLLNAYLQSRPIYLFDEWAADQDPTFKDIFYTQILANLKAQGKIIFVISHDDQYFHLADRLIKLDYGSVVYNGAPEQAAYAR